MADDPTPAEEIDVPEEAAVEEPETVHGALVTTSCGQQVLHPSRGELVALVSALRDEEDGFHLCLDVTAVDHKVNRGDRGLPAGVEPERFEVVVTLLSMARREGSASGSRSPRTIRCAPRCSISIRAPRR